MKIGFVIIGRNEGQRLVNCLKSLPQGCPKVYVDSGSTDNSCENAANFEADVVALDMSIPFTAARARNEGWRSLVSKSPSTEYIQFLDGDCELAEGWLEAAYAYLEMHAEYAVVCGRRRETKPENSVYNALCDIEWNTPIGDAKACGGDALMRVKVLNDVNGYNDGLIAGEEPELCVRIRQTGHKICRLDHEMTLHNAAMTKFSQWWKRNVRSGFAYANGAALHGGKPERHWVKETVRACVWGGLVPLLPIVGLLVGAPWLLLLYAVYPLQWVRLIKSAPKASMAKEWAAFMVLAKFAEFQGVAQYLYKRAMGKTATLIEYK